MNKLIQISKSQNETFKAGYELAKKIDKTILVGLTGELGTGKTVFAKGFGYGLGVKEIITSPTFLGISEYYSGRLPFIHMDFFKKVITQEIINSYLKKKSVVLIEWIENFTSAFKANLKPDISIYIQYLRDKEGNIQEHGRQVIIDPMVY